MNNNTNKRDGGNVTSLYAVDGDKGHKVHNNGKSTEVFDKQRYESRNKHIDVSDKRNDDIDPFHELTNKGMDK